MNGRGFCVIDSESQNALGWVEELRCLVRFNEIKTMMLRCYDYLR